MSTITSEFTKEQLQEIIETDHVQCGEASALARIALASLEAEPVGCDACGGNGSVDIDHGEMGIEHIECPKCYTAPPAPVSVPDEDLLHMAASAIDDLISNKDRSGAGVWADIPSKLRRAAMLQGADGNSPVIPDSWVLVPVEPTEDMIVNGFESEPDESFSDEDEWEAYDAMSGCQQAAHRAKLCYAAMIAAAPKPKP